MDWGPTQGPAAVPVPPVGVPPVGSRTRTRLLPPSDRDVEAAFEAVQRADSGPVELGELESDERTERDLRELFGQIAVAHTAQIREFIMELSINDTNQQWAELCRASVFSLRCAAKNIGYDDLFGALRTFENAIKAAQEGPEERIQGETRAAILEAYEELRRTLPDAFDVDDERDRREPVLVHHLLQLVDGVGRLETDRVYAAGLCTLETLYQANPSDLAAATGLRLALCDGLVRQLAEYRAHRASSAPDEDAYRRALRSLVSDLRDVQASFEDADGSARRRLRKRRTILVIRLNLQLAELGELDMIDELARCSVERKVQRVEEYLTRPPTQRA